MIKINLGCGWRNFGSDWVHIDGGDYPHLDSTDIFNLPYKDNSVDLIYTSHVIEYFDREEVIPIISEWFTKIKPGGVFRVAVPNFKEIARMYAVEGYDLQKFIGLLYGKMPMGDQTIYHKTTYDFDHLSSILKKCGFSQVNYYNWQDTDHAQFDDHSQAYLPHMDKENGTLMSLNVEAKKW